MILPKFVSCQDAYVALHLQLNRAHCQEKIPFDYAKCEKTKTIEIGVLERCLGETGAKKTIEKLNESRVRHVFCAILPPD